MTTSSVDVWLSGLRVHVTRHPVSAIGLLGGLAGFAAGLG